MLDIVFVKRLNKNTLLSELYIIYRILHPLVHDFFLPLFCSAPSAKLQSYSVTAPQTSSCPPLMQTIPESGVMGVTREHDAPQGNTTVSPSHRTLQHIEPHSEPPESDHTPSHRILQHMELLSEPPEPDHAPKKHMTSSTSLDSLLSLTDLEFGMEERAGVTEDTDGAPPPRKHSKQEEIGKSKVCSVRAWMQGRQGPAPPPLPSMCNLWQEGRCDCMHVLPL